MHSRVSTICWTESVMKHAVTGIVIPSKVVPFWACVKCLAFLSGISATTEFKFLKLHVQWSQTATDITDILEMALSCHNWYFIPRNKHKQPEAKSGEQRRWANTVNISTVPEHAHKAAQFSTQSVMVNKLVIIPPLFWMFSANLLPEVILVNR
jgi:hypothetical protein